MIHNVNNSKVSVTAFSTEPPWTLIITYRKKIKFNVFYWVITKIYQTKNEKRLEVATKLIWYAMIKNKEIGDSYVRFFLLSTGIFNIWPSYVIRYFWQNAPHFEDCGEILSEKGLVGYHWVKSFEAVDMLYVGVYTVMLKYMWFVQIHGVMFECM